MSYRQPFRGDFPITQRYGEVIPGVTYMNAPHTGIDYGCPEGTEILASDAGVVMFASFDNYGFGNTVIIQHNDGKATVYAHLKRICVVLKEKLEQGDMIGISGQTGNATGPHLHFEARLVWSDYKTHKNPITFLPLTNVIDEEKPKKSNLKGAESFSDGDIVKVVAPLGAKAFRNDSFDYYNPAPQGTHYYYTGQTTQHKGYTYMQVIPMTRPVWVAVNDGDCQILDKNE